MHLILKISENFNIINCTNQTIQNQLMNLSVKQKAATRANPYVGQPTLENLVCFSRAKNPFL